MTRQDAQSVQFRAFNPKSLREDDVVRVIEANAVRRWT
jgi:hypothetical protein